MEPYGSVEAGKGLLYLYLLYFNTRQFTRQLHTHTQTHTHT
jgi:hypothetical protein